jgi:hypothetical protein
MIDAALLTTPEVPELLLLDSQGETFRAFRNRLECLTKEFPVGRPFLVELQGGAAFLSSCQAVRDAQVKLWEAEKHQFAAKATAAASTSSEKGDEQQQNNNNNEAAVAASAGALELAQQFFTRTMNDCERLAAVVLETPELANILSNQCDNDLLVHLIQLTVLTQARPDHLAQWCDTYDDGHENNDNKKNPIASTIARDLKRALLHDGASEALTLLLPCLESGGARQGRYGRALEIYHTLLTQPCVSSHAVLRRLALAVALEHAEPYVLFGDCGRTHPYRRFDHYARAYARGELDPVTSRFDVRELRRIVDSDAPDTALEWGRVSLQNYRPDLVGSNDMLWRYCQIVRTDVAYGTPKWYKEPRSYDQILSGGGKCGPRAW